METLIKFSITCILGPYNSTGTTSFLRDVCFCARTFEVSSLQGLQRPQIKEFNKFPYRHMRVPDTRQWGERAGRLSICRQERICTLSPVKEESWEEGVWCLNTKESIHICSHVIDYLQEDCLGKRCAVVSEDRTLRNTGRGPPFTGHPLILREPFILSRLPGYKPRWLWGQRLGPGCRCPVALTMCSMQMLISPSL